MATRLLRYLNPKIGGALMVELYRLYDHGGHSGRSIKSQLLESALHISPRPHRQEKVTRETLESLPETIQRRRKGQGRPQPLLFLELPHLSNEEYASLVIWHVCEQNRLYWGEVSLMETMLLEQLSLALEVEERLIQFRTLSVTPEDLIREGRRRFDRLHKD